MLGATRPLMHDVMRTVLIHNTNFDFLFLFGAIDLNILKSFSKFYGILMSDNLQLIN